MTYFALRCLRRLLVAFLLLAAPARAQIALVDNELTTASPISSTSAFLLLKTNLTVSASANTVVVEVAFRNNDTTLTEAPPTLGWTNATSHKYPHAGRPGS